MKILLIILALILLLLLIVVLRTLVLKSTTSKDVKIEPEVSIRADRYGERLSKMIQFETISSRFDPDRSKFHEFHKMLEQMFPQIHKNCEKNVFNGSLLFKWSGKGNSEPILLMSHHDVVEAAGNWEHDPFSGDIDDEGRVWGRGSVDTKGSLFCILTAVEELIEEGYVPECDVYIASGCTEEWSGEGGPLIVNHLKDKGVMLSLVLDEGGMIIDNPISGVTGTYGMVGVVEKGYGDLKFIARGKGGHASAPGKNTPLVRLGQFMSEIEKKNPFKTKLTPTVLEMFKRLAPNMKFSMKLIFANMWLFRPVLAKILPRISPAAGAMIRTSVAFTTAKGSDGLNVLPREAYVTANMRFIHHQSNDESIALISQIAKKYDIETEIIYEDYPCPVVDYKCDAFKLIEDVSDEVYPGVGICPYVMTGATDAKFYGDVSRNCIRFAPLYINNQQYSSIHAINENIFKGVLPKAVDFYKLIIKKS